MKDCKDYNENDLMKLENFVEAMNQYNKNCEYTVFGVRQDGSKQLLEDVAASAWAYSYSLGGGNGSENPKNNIAVVSKDFRKLHIIRRAENVCFSENGHPDRTSFNSEAIIVNPFFNNR